jgi:hypothetical protein
MFAADGCARKSLAAERLKTKARRWGRGILSEVFIGIGDVAEGTNIPGAGGFLKKGLQWGWK